MIDMTSQVSWKFAIHVAVTWYGLRHIATQDYAWYAALCVVLLSMASTGQAKL